jgi:hypothetical protein
MMERDAAAYWIPPQEPVTGRAEGETRWWGMTEAFGKPQSGLYD